MWFALILLGPGANTAWGQQPLPRIWDVQPGTPVGDLPEEEFVDPACGTNGGPPGLRIGGFEQFERCRAESSGLREIWFRYDDEWEYIARAARDSDGVARANAMVVLGQPVVLSLLVDPAGLVQGYRIITDPHAHQDLRIDAYTIAIAFKARFVDRAVRGNKTPATVQLRHARHFEFGQIIVFINEIAGGPQKACRRSFRLRFGA